MFRALFSRPFGPKAFEDYQVDYAKVAPAVFGVSEDHKFRMDQLLEQSSTQARSRRHVGATMLGGVGAVMAATGAYGYSQSNSNGQKAFSLSLGIVGGGTLLAGVLTAAISSDEEDLFHEHTVGMRSSHNQRMVIANTESKLYALAEKYRSQRTILRYAMMGLGALGITTVAMTAADTNKSRGEQMGGYLVGGLLIAESAGLILATYIKYPTEQMAELWMKDPGLKRLNRQSSNARAKSSVTIQPIVGLDSIGIFGAF